MTVIGNSKDPAIFAAAQAISIELNRLTAENSSLRRDKNARCVLSDLRPGSHFEWEDTVYVRGYGIFCTALCSVLGKVIDQSACGIEGTTVVNPRPDLDGNVCRPQWPEGVVQKDGEMMP
jgi:hypothetical protein